MRKITKLKLKYNFLGLGEVKEDLIDKKIQELLDAKQVDKEFKDVGKRVSGSKKEKSAYKIVTFLDLQTLEADSAMAHELVTKDRVYPVLDIQSEKNRGVSSGAAYLKAEFRSACSKQTQNNPKSRAGFIKTINQLVQDFEKCFTVNDILDLTSRYSKWTSKEFLSILFDPQQFENSSDDETAKYLKDKFSATSVYSGLIYKTLALTFGKPFANLFFRNSESAMIHWENARKYQRVSKEEGDAYLTKFLNNQDRIIKDAEEKIIKIKSLSGSKLTAYLNTLYALDRSYFKKTDDELWTQFIGYEEKRIKKVLENRAKPDIFQMKHDDIWEWFEGDKTQKIREESPERKINSGIPLDHIERKGGITIPSRFMNEARNTVETKNPLFNVFGFKSIQFGNAQTDSESREHMRHFLGAVTDLGEILDIDIKQFNQIGSLSMAFATRGVGSANATYYPGKKIINLTNKRGDGTFAHEWGHYLDNILTMLSSSNTSNSMGMASHLENKNSRTQGVIVNKAENYSVQMIMEDIMTFIDKGDSTVSKGYKKRFTRLEKPKYTTSINRITGNPEPLESKGTTEETFKYYANINMMFGKKLRDRYFIDLQREYIESLITILDIPYFDVPMKGNTSDYFEYSAMMGSAYWIEPHELFARAWETYIFDKLAKAGRSNNYLTSDNYFKKVRLLNGQAVCLYPESAEREYLFNLFDNLIVVVKKQYSLGSFSAFSNTRKDEYERFDEYSFEIMKSRLLKLNLQ